MRAAEAEWYAEKECYGVRWEFRECLDDLGGFGRSILEVGCGEGIFLGMAQAVGYDATGLDLNSAAIAVAKAKGLSAFTLTLEAYTADEHRQFDGVVLFHTLEHVEDPHALLCNIARVLRPGGPVSLSVPSPNRWQLAIGEREWFDYPPHHLVRFTTGGLRRLLERSGFRMERLIEEPISPWLAVHSGLWNSVMNAVSFGATVRAAAKAAGDLSRGTAPRRWPLWLRCAVRAKAVSLHVALAPVSTARFLALRKRLKGRSGLSMYVLATKR